MQQSNVYVPAASAGTMHTGRTSNDWNRNMDWNHEITPPSQVYAMQDTGMGGMTDMGDNSSNYSGQMQMQGQGNMQMPGNLQMQNRLPDDVIEAPTTTGEVYIGSLKAMLRRNLGNYVVATFLVGTQNTVSWEGVLYDVGNDYVTIYQEGRDRYIVNDIYSLKYMEFYDVRRRQMCSQLLQEQGWDPNKNWRPSR